MLKTGGYAYIAAAPRFGKSLSSLLVYEHSKRVQSILIICPKGAIPGWRKFIMDSELQENYLTKSYTIINYEAIGAIKLRTHKIDGTSLKKSIPELKLNINPDDYDALIIDEAHRLAKTGKPSQRYKLIQAVAQDKPWIALSGTQVVETPLSIYYQTSFSSKSPFSHKSFYDFFREYGIPAPMKIYDRQVEQYKLSKPILLDKIREFTLFRTQVDAGISADLQAKPIEHYVELSLDTKQLYNKLQSDRLLYLPSGDLLVCDTVMKLRTALHQLESGVAKLDDETYLQLGNLEKINYIKQNFVCDENTVILAYYIGEQILLKDHFPNSHIDSVISKAEGVDYSGKEFIIFSLGWSGAKGIQVRERGVNVNNTEQAVIHYIMCKNAISHQVYKCVEQKKMFNDSTYKPTELI